MKCLPKYFLNLNTLIIYKNTEGTTELFNKLSTPKIIHDYVNKILNIKNKGTEFNNVKTLC